MCSHHHCWAPGHLQRQQGNPGLGCKGRCRDLLAGPPTAADQEQED